MNLSVEDATRFYGVWFPLLAYTCRQQQVLPDVSAGDDVPALPVTDVAKMRDALLEHPELLGRFIAENPEHLAPDQLAIAAAWEHRIAGDFFVVRFLKAYSVFMGASDPAHLYGVLGLYDPLEELLGGASLPLYVRAVLLPFEGKIVYDGLITTHSIYFGPGIRSSTSEQYNRAKGARGHHRAVGRRRGSAAYPHQPGSAKAAQTRSGLAPSDRRDGRQGRKDAPSRYQAARSGAGTAARQRPARSGNIQ